jgi:hypothetical protein
MLVEDTKRPIKIRKDKHKTKADKHSSDYIREKAIKKPRIKNISYYGEEEDTE